MLEEEKKTKSPIYLTTTLPYVNADPHLGFALEAVQADALKRFFEVFKEKEVFLNTGVDEHGLKIYRKALEEGREPQEYVDSKIDSWKNLLNELNIKPSNFIRTTDPKHKKAAKEFWTRCLENGDIYKANYTVKYCVGCELEKTESELEEGRCPVHPNLDLELIEEENYFFRFSRYKDKLLDLYEECSDFVSPKERFNEIKSFIEAGPRDFSISRVRNKMPWGIEVPDDPEQVMYVWFDALINYISTLGWPENKKNFEKWWPAVQFAGKDNLRQQSAMFQAMLLSAGIEPSRKIIIHGYITSGGFKMSKSLGNVVNPFEVITGYGVDALRYYLLGEIPTFGDGDFTWERMRDSYNANLANGIGNLSSRILKMSSKYGVWLSVEDMPEARDILNIHSEFEEFMENYNLSVALSYIWKEMGQIDKHIEETQPFKNIKLNEEKAKGDVYESLRRLWEISTLLQPFMPETARVIKDSIKDQKIPPILFARKD